MERQLAKIIYVINMIWRETESGKDGSPSDSARWSPSDSLRWCAILAGGQAETGVPGKRQYSRTGSGCTPPRSRSRGLSSAELREARTP